MDFYEELVALEKIQRGIDESVTKVTTVSDSVLNEKLRL